MSSKSQQVGLVGNIRNNIHDAVDVLRMFPKLRHIVLGCQRYMVHLTDAVQ